jgi:hypothetical protein
MRTWMIKQKSWCNIPDEVIENMKEGTGKTAQIAERACEAAAERGDLSSLQFLREYNFSWGRVMRAAILGGHFHILEWARLNGLALGPNFYSCVASARANSIEMLEWAKAHDIACRYECRCLADENNHLDMLEWLDAHHQGGPHNFEITRADIEAIAHDGCLDALNAVIAQDPENNNTLKIAQASPVEIFAELANASELAVQMLRHGVMFTSDTYTRFFYNMCACSNLSVNTKAGFGNGNKYFDFMGFLHEFSPVYDLDLVQEIKRGIPSAFDNLSEEARSGAYHCAVAAFHLLDEREQGLVRSCTPSKNKIPLPNIHKYGNTLRFEFKFESFEAVQSYRNRYRAVPHCALDVLSMKEQMGNLEHKAGADIDHLGDLVRLKMRVKNMCGVCGKTCSQRCAKCHIETFCSNECVEIGWRVFHKRECRHLRVNREVRISTKGMLRRTLRIGDIAWISWMLDTCKTFGVEVGGVCEFAAMHNKLPIIKMAVERGLQMNPANILRIATKRGFTEILEWLK